MDIFANPDGSIPEADAAAAGILKPTQDAAASAPAADGMHAGLALAPQVGQEGAAPGAQQDMPPAAAGYAAPHQPGMEASMQEHMRQQMQLAQQQYFERQRSRSPLPHSETPPPGTGLR